jgi:hypothetical protein
MQSFNRIGLAVRFWRQNKLTDFGHLEKMEKQEKGAAMKLNFLRVLTPTEIKTELHNTLSEAFS